MRPRPVRAARLLHRSRRRRPAGRRGDFLTSPEVGPLFGAVLARYLDAEWDAARPARPVHRRRRRRRARARWPAPCSRPRPACAAALRYVAVEVSAAQRARHPAGVESRARPARRSRSTASCSPTSCSTTCRSASPCTTARGARRSSRRRPTARSPRCCRRRSTRVPGGAAGHGRPRCPGPAAGRGRGVGGAGPRASSAAARCVVVDYARAAHGRARRARRGGSGCARTAATSAARTSSPTPATRTSPSTSPLDQLPEPDAVRTQAAVPAALRHRRARRRGPRGRGRRPRPRPDLRRHARCAAGSPRPRRCSTRPGSAASASWSGRLPRSPDGRGVGSTAPVRGGRVEQSGEVTGARTARSTADVTTPAARPAPSAPGADRSAHGR